MPGAFDTARQIETVYSLFAGEDLRTLLNGYVDQAKAMSMLFAAAGGLIEAQDEAVAAALGKAAQEPVGLQSLGLLGSLGSMSAMLDVGDGRSTPGGYDRVGPEEVSGAPLARMVSGAQALEPGQFAQVGDRVGAVAAELQTAAAELQQGLGDALGSQWQGEFATQAGTSVRSFTSSVTDLATVLEQVAAKAGIAENGFSTTRSRITDESMSFQAAQVNAPGFGPLYGPPTRESSAAMAAAEAAAEEQARAIVNTVYSPAVMDANLADLDIPSPYRVVSASALGGAGGVDLVSAWNVDGIARSAGAAAPSAEAIAAAGGGGNPGAGAGALGGGAVGGGAGQGATTTSLRATATDAATEQALLASRGGAVDGGGAAAASAGQAPAGGAHVGGFNAATTPAGSPLIPGATVNGQPVGSGVGAAGTRGIRNGAGARNRDRGFGSASGLLGAGGATATGAGAARMGGAGTLAGFGAPGGPGAGGLSVGGPGNGGPGTGGPSGGAGAAGGPAGALSSSSTGGAQAGRAGMVPMGMMGAAGVGQNDGRRGHTPAGYLTNATNASAIVGDPVKVAPAVLGRTAPVEAATAGQELDQANASAGRVIGRDFRGGEAAR